MTPSDKPVRGRITDFKCSKPLGSQFPKKSFYIEITGFKTSGAAGSSKICIEVFQRRYFRKNKRIGMFEDTIESLFQESLFQEGSSEVARALRNDFNMPSPVSLTFSISTLSNDAASSSEEVLSQAREGLSGMKGEPSALVKVAGMALQAPGTPRPFGDICSSVIEKLELFTKITDELAQSSNLKIHPYARTACMILSVIPKIIIGQKIRDNAVYHLMETIDDIHSFLKDAEPLKTIKSHSKVIVALGSLTVECAMDKNFWTRIAKLTFSGVESTIKQYEKRFQDLQAHFKGSALVNIDITVMRCLRKIENMSEHIENMMKTMIKHPSDTDLIIGHLPYADGAGFDPDKSCIRGTRIAALKEIHEWINKEDGDDTARILVLTGVAGVGKSAIANTVAQHYDAVKRLGSFVSFDRADQARRHPGNLLSTVARDIADLDLNWKSALYDTVKHSHSLRKNTSPIRQMESFVLEPAKALAIVGPIVVVIDTLDESGDALARRSLLKALAENASKLPRNFRVLITSRAEDDIVQTFSDKLPHIQQQTIKTTDEAMDADITKFITKELLEFDEDLEQHPECSDGKGVNMLVNGSGRLFERAATVCRVIQNGGDDVPVPALLLKMAAVGSELDDLYTSILRQTFHDKAMPRFRQVLGGILAAKEPLPMASHSAILQSEGEEKDIVLRTVGPLGSLLHGVGQNESPQVPIRAHHTSFFDFLQDEKRSKEFFVDTTKQDRNIVLGCLRVMKEELRFNICGLETSHVLNADVPDLPARVQTHITPHLLYACRFLRVHLETTTHDKQVGIELEHFLREHLLHWLEVLSLTKLDNTASRCLSSIAKWSQSPQSHNADLAAFAKDAKMFVNVFAPAIHQSAPHIYLSALPFAPKLSLVSRQYLPRYPSTIHLTSGSVEMWPAALRTLDGHTSGVTAVAYSPDGRHIVSCSRDKTMQIWDAETGEAAGEPLRGHTEQILCVAYAPNGRRLVSGSSDKTIRIWDAETGEAVGEPLRGHTSSVMSVACSPDGRYIVSGSGDQTIRMWDAETGKAVGAPLRGHAHVVWSVACSPDGGRIVSGSGDKTIRMWDARTGEAVGAPLKGHTALVMTVAYSADGARIVSSSCDNTIRVWDAETGKPIGHPIHESARVPNSVAYSPNGVYIVSGYGNGMLCVWDAETGAAIGEAFKGHTYAIKSVAYSPDGTAIISCSDDGTVRVWNAETCQAGGVQVAESSSEWNVVTYSPDGTRLASAPREGRTCVWDAETGRAVADLCPGETGYVQPTMATAFSSDGTRVIWCGGHGHIRTWESETGAPARAQIQLDLGFRAYCCAAFSPDGTRIAVQDYTQAEVSGAADYNHVIRVFDAATGKAVGRPHKKHTSRMQCIAYPPEGTCIALGFNTGTVCLWDPETGGDVGEPLEHGKSVHCLAYSPDGTRIVSGSDDCELRMWDAETHAAVGGPLRGHTAAVMTVAWSPDGTYIISGSKDQTIRAWDAETGLAVRGPLRGHSGSVTSIACSPDGTRFASASADKTIRV
ncbi:WD40 repeat-like protein [Athelia psychrophila]|uniref:WD40 repeat-like protein n=1 Tax=Athelia psychrophila TaxID=1759441 RepID=A0A166GHR6_9AGAM|nr:WD40 repeat-like protein [Fibularhizoctonia sp. CBS 109695]